MNTIITYCESRERCDRSRCKTKFQHSQISDVGMYWLELPEKPSISTTGNACVCPNCGHSANYRQTDLMYRASRAAAAGG